MCSAPNPSLTGPIRQCPSLFTTTSLWVWGISDAMPSFPRSAQRAPSNCYCHSVLDRKALDPCAQQHDTCDLSQQTCGLLMLWGHLCIRKPKQIISPSRSRQRGSSQAPPSNFSAPHFADLRGFYADFRLQARGFSAPHATRILKRDNAKFGTKFRTRIFRGTPTYNFQYFWPKKFHAQKSQPKFHAFSPPFFDPFYLPSLALGRSRTRDQSRAIYSLAEARQPIPR